MDKRKDYDAKDAWLVVDGKRIFGFGDIDFYLAKDNSKDNQKRLSEDFKYSQSQPIPSKRAINLYNVEYVQIPHKDFSLKGRWIK